MYNKKFKISIIILSITAILIDINLGSYPKSYSYYMDSKDAETNPALKYQASTIPIYSDISPASLNVSSSTSTVANLSIDLYKNRNVNSIKDKYQIEIPNNIACTFKSINTNGTITPTSIAGTKSFSINYSANQSSTSEKSTINLECTVNETDGIKISDANPITVLEILSGNQYLYKKFTFSRTYDEYLNELPQRNPYAALLNWVNTNYNGNKYDAVYYYVIENKFNSEKYFNDNIDSLVSNTGLLGFGIENNDSNYTFKAQENFWGYAKTDWLNISPLVNRINFYIDTKEETTQKNAFNIYLEKYIFPEDSEKDYREKAEKNIDITAFINSNDSNSNPYKGKGIYKQSNNAELYYILKSELISYLDTISTNEVSTNSVSVNIDDASTMSNNLRTSLASYSDIIPEETLNSILPVTTKKTSKARTASKNVSNEIYLSLMTGATDRAEINSSIKEAQSFVDYFILPTTDEDGNANKYLLFKVYSDDAKTNNVKFTSIYIPEGMSISFNNAIDKTTNKNPVLNIEISYNKKEFNQSLYDTFISNLKDFIDEDVNVPELNESDTDWGCQIQVLKIVTIISDNAESDEPVLDSTILDTEIPQVTETPVTTPPKDNKPIDEIAEIESSETPIGGTPPDNISTELPLVVINKAEVLEDFKKAAIDTNNEDIIDYKVIPPVKLATPNEEELSDSKESPSSEDNSKEYDTDVVEENIPDDTSEDENTEVTVSE